MKTKIFTLTVLSCLCVAGPSWAETEEENWNDTMSVDHAGFADGTAIVNEGRFQLESGMKFTSDQSSTNWLARYGFSTDMELRFVVSGLVAPYSDAAKLAVDTLEAGFKYRLYNGEKIQFSVLPYAIFPSGSPISSAVTLSGGIKILSDISLTDSIGISLSAYPKMLGKTVGTSNKYVFDSAFAFSAGWSLSKQFGVCIDVFTEMSKGASSYEFSPAADFGIIYMYSPDVTFDVYIAAPLNEDKITPKGGFGMSFRL